MPVEVVAVFQLAGGLVALQEDGELGLVRGLLDGTVDQGLVGHDAARFDPAGGGEDGARLGVVDPHRKFMRGKAAEHHRMHRPQPGAGQHRLERFGHHGHVDDHAVALFDAARAQGSGQPRHAGLQLGIGDPGLGAGDRAVVDDRHLVAAPASDVPVDGVPAAVEPPVRKPFVEVFSGFEERLRRLLVPVDRLGQLHPVALGIVLPALIYLGIAHDRLLHPLHSAIRRHFRSGKGLAAC